MFVKSLMDQKSGTHVLDNLVTKAFLNLIKLNSQVAVGIIHPSQLRLIGDKVANGNGEDLGFLLLTLMAYQNRHYTGTGSNIN